MLMQIDSGITTREECKMPKHPKSQNANFDANRNNAPSARQTYLGAEPGELVRRQQIWLSLRSFEISDVSDEKWGGERGWGVGSETERDREMCDSRGSLGASGNKVMSKVSNGKSRLHRDVRGMGKEVTMDMDLVRSTRWA